MTFRDDLNRAADWVDAYLKRVGELPVAARTRARRRAGTAAGVATRAR